MRASLLLLLPLLGACRFRAREVAAPVAPLRTARATGRVTTSLTRPVSPRCDAAPRYALVSATGPADPGARLERLMEALSAAAVGAAGIAALPSPSAALVSSGALVAWGDTESDTGADGTGVTACARRPDAA